jgi:hypothetical protein
MPTVCSLAHSHVIATKAATMCPLASSRVSVRPSDRKRLSRFPLILYGKVYQNLQKQTHSNFDHSKTQIRNMAVGSTCTSRLISTGQLRKYLTGHKTVPRTSYRQELRNLHNKSTIRDNSTQAIFMLPIHTSRTNTLISVRALNSLLVHLKRMLLAGCIRKLTSETETPEPTTMCTAYETL